MKHDGSWKHERGTFDTGKELAWMRNNRPNLDQIFSADPTPTHECESKELMRE